MSIRVAIVLEQISNHKYKINIITSVQAGTC